MDSNHQKWPNSWDYHIAQYCNFYFCDKDIKYLDKKFWTEAKTDRSDIKIRSMDLKFQISNHRYLVNIRHNDGSHFSCSIFYRKPFKNSNDPTDLHISSLVGKDIFLLDDIAGIGGRDMSVSEIMEFAENAMWDDHQRRNDNDWDNDDGENAPIEPFSPTNVVELELTLI